MDGAADGGVAARHRVAARRGRQRHLMLRRSTSSKPAAPDGSYRGRDPTRGAPCPTSRPSSPRSPTATPWRRWSSWSRPSASSRSSSAATTPAASATPSCGTATGMLMLSERTGVHGPPPGQDFGEADHSVYVVVEDVDAHAAQARAHGADVFREPADTPYDSREYAARDPEGHLWSFGTYVPGSYAGDDAAWRRTHGRVRMRSPRSARVGHRRKSPTARPKEHRWRSATAPLRNTVGGRRQRPKEHRRRVDNSALRNAVEGRHQRPKEHRRRCRTTAP